MPPHLLQSWGNKNIIFGKKQGAFIRQECLLGLLQMKSAKTRVYFYGLTVTT